MRVKDAASFRIDLEEDGTGRMAVFDGSIEVAGDKAHLYVRKGEIIRFQSEDPDRYFLSADYQQDDWDRWNEERTAYIAKRAGSDTTMVTPDGQWRIWMTQGIGTPIPNMEGSGVPDWVPTGPLIETDAGFGMKISAGHGSLTNHGGGSLTTTAGGLI